MTLTGTSEVKSGELDQSFFYTESCEPGFGVLVPTIVHGLTHQSSGWTVHPNLREQRPSLLACHQHLHLLECRMLSCNHPLLSMLGKVRTAYEHLQTSTSASAVQSGSEIVGQAKLGLTQQLFYLSYFILLILSASWADSNGCLLYFYNRHGPISSSNLFPAKPAKG